MDQFVCIRIVKGNTIDLSLFQFDYDLTFAMIFMNAADRTIYGRYGTRDSVKEAEKDISLVGLRETLEGVLQLHRDFAEIRDSLAGKQPQPTTIKTPLDYPFLAKQYKDKLDFEGQVSRSCLHCHQVRIAELQSKRELGQAISNQVIFSYPRPEVVGIELDPDTRAKVRAVATDSAASDAGLLAGDEILELAGQPILSIADMQWVLHTAGEQGQISVTALRNGNKLQLELPLKLGWREASDLEWRTSTWDLRRMLGGGMVLEELTDDERTDHELQPTSLALRIKRLGQYGDHAVARKSGFKEGDIITDYNGHRGRLTESQLLAKALGSTSAGQRVVTKVMRDGEIVTVQMVLPKAVN